MKTLCTLPAIALLCCFGITTVSARLGETPEEITKRYGAPVRSRESTRKLQIIGGGSQIGDCGLPTTNFVFKEFFIAVTFLDGHSVRERLVPKAFGYLSGDQAIALRDAISPDDEWTGHSYESRWKSRKGSVAEHLGGSLDVRSAAFIKHAKDFAERKNQQQAEAYKKKADGF